jgi:membrane protein involved in colicin uptake
MAAPKKPTGGSKPRSTRSSGARKAATKKAPAKNAAAKKPAAKKAPAPAKGPIKTAKIAKAEATAPSLRPGRSRRRWGRVAAVVALLAAAGVVIGLIAGGSGSDDNANVAQTTPTATSPATNGGTAAASAAPVATAPAVTPPPAATPAAKHARQAASCDPIVGTGTVNGGKSYDVTSSASGSQDPAGCGEAHSVLLSALSSQSTSVGDWSCTTNPGGSTVAVCKSGGRTIQARG